MPINLESHGLPAAAAYNAPVTVQDQQGGGQGQQQTPEAGYSPSSAFEAAPGASVAHAAVQPEAEPAGGDLLSKLSGFIKAVGDVVVQLGEFIRNAGGALNGAEGDAQGQVQAQAQGQGQAGAPAAQTAPAANANAQPQAAQVPQQQVPQGLPGVGQPQLSAVPAQPSYAAAVLPTQTRLPAQVATPDLRGGAALGSKSTPTPPRGVASVSSGGVELSSAGQASAAPRGGGSRSASSSGFPVLNPLPPYLGDAIAALPEFLGGGTETETFPGNVSMSATARPPVQPSISGEQQLAALFQPGTAEVAAAEAGATEAVAAEQAIAPAEEPALPDNVIPIRRSLSSEPQAAEAAPLPTDSSSLGYSAIVFRPAFYGNLRC